MHKQLYPKRWREIREAVKERAHYRCEECGIEEGTIQISRHTGRRYILYLHAAHLGDNPRDGHQRNLRCLCPACHMRLDRHHESQARKSARRRGYQITTTDRLVAALALAGLSITETERGYDWQMDDLQGHAPSAISTVADALYTLRQLRDEETSLATRSTIAPTDARSVAYKLGQLQAQLIQLSCLHDDDDDLLPVYQQCTAQFADEVLHDLYQVIHGVPPQPSPTSQAAYRNHTYSAQQNRNHTYSAQQRRRNP
jgi:hypothetical protein